MCAGAKERGDGRVEGGAGANYQQQTSRRRHTDFFSCETRGQLFTSCESSSHPHSSPHSGGSIDVVMKHSGGSIDVVMKRAELAAAETLGKVELRA